MTFQEAKQALSLKLNINYSNIARNGQFSDTDLGNMIQQGLLRAWNYKPWDFTEGAKSLTTIDTEYFDYPQDIASGSIFVLMIAGKEYRKVTFQDYKKYKSEYPTGTEKIWAEYKRFVFVNQLAYSVGDEMIQLGKLNAPQLSGASDLLPFSPDADAQEDSGNMAIILLAHAEALDSEKKKNPAQARIEEKKAYEILDLLWAPVAKLRATQQSKNRPFFDVPDYFGNANNSQNIGNFNI